MEARKQQYLKDIAAAGAVDRLMAEKVQERQRNEKFNITPLAPPQRSVAEEQLDVNLQRQRAYDHLLKDKSISPEVSQEFLQSLTAPDLVLLNQVWSDFAKDLARFQHLDAEFLMTLWRRYVEKYRRTLGVDIPLQSGELVQVKPPEAKEVKSLHPARVALEERANARAETILDRRGETEGRYHDHVRDSKDAAGKRADIQAEWTRVQEILKDIRRIYDSLKERARDHPDDVEALNLEIGKLRKNANKLYDDRNALEKEFQALSHLDPPEEVRRGIERGLTGVEGAPHEPDERMVTAGHGILRVPRRAVHVRFGMHYLHQPSLDRGILSLRYPSKGKHHGFGEARISLELVRVLKEALMRGRFTTEMLADLSTEEKHLLVRLGRISNVSIPLVMGEERGDLHRFELLRGELEAGNDSPLIVKELKTLILKMMADGRISKREGRESLLELSTV